MIKYQVGIEFTPSGDTKSTHGLIGGREQNEILKKVRLNKTRNTYVHAMYDQNERLIKVCKITKREYKNLRCGFGLSNFGDFIKEMF